MTCRVVTLGETMALLRAQEPGLLQHAETMSVGVGGAESNVAIGLSRLGVNATWIGRVGRDGFGEKVLRELRAEGVDVTRAVLDESAPTGLMIKERRTEDATRVWYYRDGSAGSRLRRDDLGADMLRETTVLHLTGITPGLSADAMYAVEYALELASAAGVAVSFDVNHRARVWQGRDAAPVYRRIAAQATILFGGPDELALLEPGTRVENLPMTLAGLGPRHVVLKLGQHGSRAWMDGQTVCRPALPIRPVDTVGAGDAFVAGYLAEFCAGSAVETCLDTATTCGAFACLSHGDWEGAPRRDELSLLDRSDPVSR